LRFYYISISMLENVSLPRDPTWCIPSFMLMRNGCI